MRCSRALPLLLALALAIAPATLTAQVIVGTLRDSATGAPLARIPVWLLRVGHTGLLALDSARTDRRGRFRFTAPEGGRYHVEFGGAPPHVLRSPADSLAPDTTLMREYMLPVQGWSATAPLPRELVSREASPRGNSRFPRYPETLRKAGVTGCVLAVFAVDTTGVVEPASLRILITTDSAFTASVRHAVPEMRFTPARLGATAVRQWITSPFVFARAGLPEPRNCDPVLSRIPIGPR